MIKVYPVIFTKTNDKKDTVLVEVPDMKIYTEGYGIADAIEMARDAIGLAGITKEDKGQEIPEPREIKEVDMTACEFTKSGELYVSLVDVDFQEYRRKQGVAQLVQR